MKKILFVIIGLVLLFNLAIAVHYSRAGGTAFYVGERVSGLYKICYYNYMGSTIAITIKSYQLCPLTIQMP